MNIVVIIQYLTFSEVFMAKCIYIHSYYIVENTSMTFPINKRNEQHCPHREQAYSLR